MIKDRGDYYIIFLECEGTIRMRSLLEFVCRYRIVFNIRSLNPKLHYQIKNIYEDMVIWLLDMSLI